MERGWDPSAGPIELDRYGHLMAGSEEEAAALLDTYLCAARAGCGERSRGWWRADWRTNWCTAGALKRRTA